ncbi:MULTISPECIES: hypothetical protein [Cyanophyceae]|uniref:Uncharacterized protein n=1 Tax=Leptolyngbya subtilissima DQ-A4 TaxID=2933933 RepID=A0ABV0K1S0_9CYAN|nr:hypothetical protein [Nodosilinea sp. FACHB-141]MBD2112544.1 hypothetical protein [Nodosilinea sp. FACHB-141]
MSNQGFHRKAFRGFSGGDFTGGGGRNSGSDQISMGDILENSRKIKEVQEKLDQRNEKNLSEEGKLYQEWTSYVNDFTIPLSGKRKLMSGHNLKFKLIEENKAVVVCSKEDQETHVFVTRKTDGKYYHVYKLDSESGNRQYLLPFKYKRSAQHYALLLAQLEIQKSQESSSTQPS